MSRWIRPNTLTYNDSVTTAKSCQTRLEVYQHYHDKVLLHSTVALARNNDKLKARGQRTASNNLPTEQTKKCYWRRYQKHYNPKTEISNGRTMSYT